MLIVTSITVIGTSTNEECLFHVIDQSQEKKDGCIWIESGAYQEFQPDKAYNTKLTKVDVVSCCGYEDSMPLTLSINYPLDTVLTSTTLPASKIHSAKCDWVTFDIPDIELIPPNKYYIVLTFEPVSDYLWGGAWRDPYPQGNSSLYDDWDWCFRTYAEKTQSRSINNFFEKHLFLFKLIEFIFHRLEIQI